MTTLESLAIDQSVLRTRMDNVQETVDHHDKDLYRGNGLPAITVRLANLERIAGNLGKLFWAIVAMLGIVGADLITRLLKH